MRERVSVTNRCPDIIGLQIIIIQVAGAHCEGRRPQMNRPGRLVNKTVLGVEIDANEKAQRDVFAVQLCR